LPGELAELRDVSLDDVEGAVDAVVFNGTLVPDFESLIAPLKSVVRVVLAVMGFLSLIHLYPANDRFWSSH
jgi:hypothetical protein